MKWTLRPQRLKALILHIVTLTINLVMIRAFAQHTADPVCVRHWIWTRWTMSVKRPLPGHIFVKRDAVDSFLSVKSKTWTS